VYFYRVSDLTPLVGDYLQVFSDSFQDIVLPPVTDIQCVDVSHVGLFLENLSNGVDILEDTSGFPVPGGVSEVSCMPPFVSYGFQLVRESRVTRPGYKRFAGVPEEWVTDGVYSAGTEALEAVEEALGADFLAGIAHYAAPVIVKRPFEVPAVTYEYSDLSAGLFKGIGTQNTRKLGRGA